MRKNITVIERIREPSLLSKKAQWLHFKQIYYPSKKFSKHFCLSLAEAGSRRPIRQTNNSCVYTRMSRG